MGVGWKADCEPFQWVGMAITIFHGHEQNRRAQNGDMGMPHYLLACHHQVLSCILLLYIK